MTADEVKAALLERLEAEVVEVEDTSGGCGAMFEVVVVSRLFEGMSLLERHRLVNERIKEMAEKMHALSMKTWTPKQFQQRRG